MNNIKQIFIVVITLASFVACEKPDTSSPVNGETLETIDKVPAYAKISINDENPELKRVSMYKSKKLLEEGEYLKGFRHGTWTEYHSNGMIKAMTSYINGVKQGVHIKMEKNGEIRTRVYYVNGLQEGPYFRFKNKRTVQTGTYKNGLINGEVKRYYPTNGKLMEERFYVNDTLEGVSLFYDEEGNVKLETHFEKGVLVKTVTPEQDQKE